MPTFQHRLLLSVTDLDASLSNNIYPATCCNTRAVYTYPSKKALLSVAAKVRALTARSRHRTLEALLRQLNPVLRGWCHYFRHGVSKATFGYLDAFAWRRVTRWLRKRHQGITWKDLFRRFLTAGQETARGKRGYYVRHRTSRDHSLPLAREQHPDTMDEHGAVSAATRPREPVERRMHGDALVRCGGRAGGNGPGAIPAPRPGPTPTCWAAAPHRSRPLSNAAPDSPCSWPSTDATCTPRHRASRSPAATARPDKVRGHSACCNGTIPT